MKNKYFILLLPLLFLGSLEIKAQTEDLIVDGLVKHLDTLLPDINILNKTKNLGTSSDENGAFQMRVALGDSVLFSSVAFQNRIIVVSETHLKAKKMVVYLEPGLNELEAVELQQKIRHEWGTIAVPRGTILEMDDMSSRTPNAELFTNPTSYTGVDFMNIFYGLTSKLRAKKREKRAKQKQIDKLKQEFPDLIKRNYGTSFFMTDLKITKDEIDLFLDFCEGNGLSELYDAHEIEIKNFLIKQSKLFKNLD